MYLVPNFMSPLQGWHFFISLLIRRIIAAEDVMPLGRHKRILNGLEAPDRDSGYAVSRYVVWISNEHICTGGFDREALTVACSVDYRHERCGGALLTPTIVQTAGHCIADFRSYVEGQPLPSVRIQLDLRRFYVFAGWNKVELFEKGYGAMQYVLNPKCANMNLRNVSFSYPFPIVHDYALIILQTGVNPYEGFQFTTQNYAPNYSIENLEKMWRRLMSRELVCLFVGYGRTGPPGKVDHGSEMLRHGWGIVRNYMKCIRMVDVPLQTKEFNYVDDATWYCASPLAKHADRVTGGDSGSPVTCDNEYVGLLSQTIIPTEGNEKLIMIAPLVFSLFENAEEYRKILQERMRRFPPSQPSIIPRLPLPTRHAVIEDFAHRSFVHNSPISNMVLVYLIVISHNLI